MYDRIQNCHIYKRVQARKCWYLTILKSLSISINLLIDITLNFLPRLSSINSYNMVWVVIDPLIKKRHYISYTPNKNDNTVKAIAYLLFKHVWKLHSFSLFLTLDWALQFISGVWKYFCKIFDIKVIYLQHFIEILFDKVKFLIKKWKNNLLCLSTIKR